MAGYGKRIGTVHDRATVAYDPSALSTARCYHLTKWYPINYTQLAHPRPDYEMITAPGCMRNYNGNTATLNSSYELEGHPLLSLPSGLSSINSLWNGCIGETLGGYDPPRALRRASAIAPPITIDPAKASSTASKPAASAPNPLPTLTTRQPPAAHPESQGQYPKPSTAPGKLDDPSLSTSSALASSRAKESQPRTNPALALISPEATNQDLRFLGSEAIAAVKASAIGIDNVAGSRLSAGSADIGSSQAILESKITSPNLVFSNIAEPQWATESAANGVLNLQGSSTLPPGTQMIYDGSVGSQMVVADGTLYTWISKSSDYLPVLAPFFSIKWTKTVTIDPTAIQHPGGAQATITRPPVITFAGSLYTVSQASALLINGQILTAGMEVDNSGSVISMDPSARALIFGSRRPIRETTAMNASGTKPLAFEGRANAILSGNSDAKSLVLLSIATLLCVI